MPINVGRCVGQVMLFSNRRDWFYLPKHNLIPRCSLANHQDGYAKINQIYYIVQCNLQFIDLFPVNMEMLPENSLNVSLKKDLR